MARTLREIIETCLPDTPRSRYSDAYWVKRANFVLDEISTKLSGPYRETEVIVPLVEGVTRYRIPSQIRRVTRIRFPAGHRGVNLEDPRTGVGFTMMGDDFRLHQSPPMLEDADLFAYQTIPNGNDLQYSVVEDLTNMLSWPEDIADRGAIITHFSAPGVIESQESMFIVKKYTEPFVVRAILDGRLIFPAREGDAIQVTSNFVIVTGAKALTHFTTIDSLCPLPTQFDRVLGKGLLYYLRMAMADDGNEASVKEADSIFRMDLEELINDFNSHHGDVATVKPRSPYIYEGLRRSRRT